MLMYVVSVIANHGIKFHIHNFVGYLDVQTGTISEVGRGKGIVLCDSSLLIRFRSNVSTGFGTIEFNIPAAIISVLAYHIPVSKIR